MKFLRSGRKVDVPKIALVYAPLTLVSSWRTTIEEESVRATSKAHFEETSFSYSKFSTQWIEIRKVYMHADCVVWLFCLLFNLIKGKFHLFVTGVRYPEGIITFVVSKLLRRPVIVRDTYWYWSRDFVGNSLLWPLARFAVSHARAFVVSSQRVKRFWMLSGVPEEKIRVKPVYVSIIKVNAKHLSLAKKLKEKLHGKNVILYFGRLVKRKGIDYLIKAFSKLSNEKRNVVLFIVGAGPERSNLEKLCDDLALDNIIFTGAVSEEEKPSYFLLCDLLVYPSITMRTREEWGMTVNEAMSVGKPVVVTDVVGSAYELVKPGINGYVVPEKDIDALYSAIKKLIENHDLRVKMGQNAKKTIMESFTYKHLSDSILELVRFALLNQKS